MHFKTIFIMIEQTIVNDDEIDSGKESNVQEYTVNVFKDSNINCETEFDDDHVQTCEDENSSDLQVTENRIPDNNESDGDEKIVTVKEMKCAINILRRAFIQEDPQGLFELHPVMDRVSKISAKKWKQSKITSYFDKK